MDKPEEPILYMIEYLDKLQGTYVKSGEKNELEKLRKEMKRYKNKFHIEEDIISDEEEEMDEVAIEEQKKFEEVFQGKVMNLAQKGCRASVRAESYDHNKKGNFNVKVIKKTEEQKSLIRERIINSFLFNNLEENELKNVIDAMGERKFKKEEIIIKQGDSGDDLYIVESGELDCFKTFNPDEERKYLKTYSKGEVFGDLALLYNAPRAATIVSKTDGVLWTLDRLTFNHIVKGAAVKKRELYEKFLKSVDIFSTINQYEISQICDALVIKRFKKGDVIIKQEERGDDFFIVEEGNLEATKLFPGKSKEEVVMKYEKGKYFGELALIKNEPRAATITAKSDCKLICLDRLTFKRLLGPIEELLKRNSAQYVKYIR